MDYAEYRQMWTDEIGECLQQLCCQPILFVGTGLSKRYFGAPSWTELLTQVINDCPNLQRPADYYIQRANGDLPKVATDIHEPIREWAWSAGRELFPPALFKSDVAPDAFLKWRVAEAIRSISPKTLKKVKDGYHSEISMLSQIYPHAIITTNYDTLLELVYSDHECVIGQQLLRAQTYSIGEIYKIHGCVSQPSSIVLTHADYEYFTSKKKYLSAKLTAFFAEHPMLIIGYGLGDPNVHAILRDIVEILEPGDDVLRNIFVLSFNPDAESSGGHPTERVLNLGEGRTIRVKSIVANSYDWVYKSFAIRPALKHVNPKVLRAVLARTYNFVRSDVPSRTVEVNWEMLTKAAEDDNGIGKLFGVTTLNDPAALNAAFPYSLTEVAEKLGAKHWTYANQLLDRVKAERQIDIKTSDNQYHVAMKASKKAVAHRYSDECVALLRAVENGKYNVRLSVPTPKKLPAR